MVRHILPARADSKSIWSCADFLVGNGYCETCVGCQKNCYDFNPKAALLTDLADEDPWFARHNLFFFAALPGFTFAFFTVDPVHEIGLFAYYRYIFGWTVASMGFFFICRSYFRLSHFRAAAFAAMLALVLFYGITAEGIKTVAAGFLGLTPPVFLDEVLIGVVASVATLVLWNGYVAEKNFIALQVGKKALRFLLVWTKRWWLWQTTPAKQ